jgi:sarcosine oxidase
MRGREFDCAVVGLGALGSAAAYWIARAGLSVIAFEQFEFGHARGASHDHSRIIRRSYHTPAYVRLAGEAYDAWHTVEDESGESLVLRTGGLDVGPLRGAAARGMEDHAASMDDAGVVYERLDAAEIMRRWPAWQLPDSVGGLFQPDAGIVAAERAGDALRRIAAERDAVLRAGARVNALWDRGGEIEVVVDGEALRCGSAVVCADAWTNDVLSSLDVSLPLRSTQEQVVYLDSPRQDMFELGRFPIWIWMDEPSFYGFPVFGDAGVKVAQDVGGREVTPDTRSFATDAAALARVEEFVDRYLPAAAGRPRTVKSCIYTLTPDRDFVVDRVPGHARIVVGLGAAHGFKFAAVLGRIMAELVTQGSSTSDIAAFRFDRTPGLEPIA